MIQEANQKPLIVKLPPTLKRRLKRAAADHDTDMSKLTRQALEEYLDRLERRRHMEAWLDEVSGTADAGFTTDEIMAMTRGE